MFFEKSCSGHFTWGTEREEVKQALHENQKMLAKELEVAQYLQNLSIQLLQADKMEELYDIILDTAMAILHADFASLQLYYPAQGEAGALYLLSHRGFSNEIARLLEWVTPSHLTSCGMALKKRQRVVVPDIASCDLIAGSEEQMLCLHNGIRASQTTLLLSRAGILMGAFSTHWSRPHQLTDSELRSLDVLARQAADLIERKHVEQQLQNGYYEMEQQVSQRTAELAQANQLLKQEIKERKQTEKAFQDSEARYRTLVNCAAEAIVVVQDDLIKFANPMAEIIFRCSEEQLKMIPFIEFVQSGDKHLLQERHKARLRGEEVENPYIFRLVAGDKVKWISKTSDIIEWEGRPAILGIMSDITDRKIMEEKMLKDDKLDSIGILAGGIAHDFNNYLATLLGNINLAKLYKEDVAKMLDKLENMEKVTLRAKDLSNQLFTFAKGGAPVKEKISILELIRENIKFTLSGSHVRPVFFISEDLYTVEADQGQLSQVLNNIAINAVQAMPDGGVLKVEAENVMLESSGPDSVVSLTKGPYVKIAIQDQGIGIPEQLLSKVFDPFFPPKRKGGAWDWQRPIPLSRTMGAICM